MSGRAVVGRGDLLRALSWAGRSGREVDEVGWADRLGFDPWEIDPLDKPVTRKLDAGPANLLADERRSEPQPTPERPPLRIQHYVVVKDEHLPQSGHGEHRDEDESASSVEAEELLPDVSHRPPPQHIDLVPFSRLLPRLRDALGGEKFAGLDAPEAVGRVARGLPWVRTPYRRRGAWPASWLVVLDLSDRLRPYWLDMHRLAAQLHSECGGQACQVRVLRQPGDPAGGWDDWVQHQPGHSAGLRPVRQAAEPGQTVLLLSDIGCGAGIRDDMTARRWQHWIAAQPESAEVVVLSPVGTLGAQSVPSHWLHWSAGLRKARTVNPSDAVARLLALCAPALRIEPRLLRELRQLLGEVGTDGGIEAAVWNHPELHSGPIACTWDEAQRMARAIEFRQLPVRLQRQVGEVLRRHHQGLSKFVGSEETLRWSACAAEGVVPTGEVRRARQHFRTFTQNVDNTAGQQIGAVRGYARRLLQRVPGLEASGRAALDVPRLAAWAWREELLRGEPVPLPDGVSYEELVLQAGGLSHENGESYALVQESGILCLQRLNSFMKGFEIARIRSAQYVDWGRTGDDRRHVVTLDRPRIELCKLKPGNFPDLDLRTADQHLVVHGMERPSWAKSWMRSKVGLFTTIESPWGEHLNIPYHEDDLFSWLAGLEPFYFGANHGVGKDKYGLFLILHIKGIVQRLRYIEPGTFLMGSPDSEPDRDDDEGPQHQVTLTEGYWLADTTCTQALWQAVMGNNPSQFKGDPDLPVENVSWDDVQQFLTKLNSFLPSGCEAALPTEAQWEFACRAGTQTPYWFGQGISENQVNFGGKVGKTVPVKGLPANGWGLYQMHGNVWEWCAGSRRQYSAQAVENPPDGQDKDFRALRGGSWFIEAWNARSASRFDNHRDSRFQFIGFRLSLRSIKPSQGQVKGSGGAAAKGVSRPAEPGKGASGRGARGKKKAL